MQDDRIIDLQHLQDVAQSNTVRENAGETTILPGGAFTLQQTNVIHYDKRVESIAVEKNKIKKIRNLCEAVQSPRAPKAEICLSIASLCAGAFLSAIISGIPVALEFRSVLFYFISPLLAVGTFVAYLFLRKNEGTSSKDLADHILEYLPEDDFDNERPVGSVPIKDGGSEK